MLVICNIDGDSPKELTQTMTSHRNAFLADSDWTQSPDSPLSDTDKTAWATYRQQLRDFPATWTPAETADFPDPPT
jgi:hypothetical protein